MFWMSLSNAGLFFCFIIFSMALNPPVGQMEPESNTIWSIIHRHHVAFTIAYWSSILPASYVATITF